MSQPRRMTLASLDTNKRAPAAKPQKGAPPVTGLRARPSLVVRPSAAPASQSPRRLDAGPRLSNARMSLAPGHRRSMGMAMGRMSLAPGGLALAASAPPIKDTRLRVKNVRALMEANVTSFIEHTGFSMPGWNPRLVHEPTQSAFAAMFKHIYRECIDDSYQMGAEGKKFEDEVMLLLKEMRYPFIDELTKTKLTAAGSQQNWPACLAMLDWVVRLGTQCAQVGSGPLEREDENELHALFFPFLWKCYEKFWDNQDEYPEETAALERAFLDKNAELGASVEALQEAKASVDEELAALTAKASPLEREQHENQVLRGDIIKFTKYHDEILVPKLEKSRRTNQRLHAALDEHRAELKEKEKERARRQSLVCAQDISGDEFDRMIGEREWLAQELEQLAQQNKDAVEQCWKVELHLTKLHAEVEKRLKTFAPLAQRVHLFPLHLSGRTQLDALELVPSNPATMLPPGLDIRRDVRPKIDALRARETARFRALSEERAACQEALDQLFEALERLRRACRAAVTRMDALRDQIDQVGRITNEEEDAASAEHLRQEELVRTIEHSSQMALQQADARLAAAQLQLQEGLESSEAERAAMHDEMCNALHTLLDLKVRISEGLDTIDDAVHGALHA